MNIRNTTNNNNQANLYGIARTLVLADVIDENVANDLNDLARKKKTSFISALLESGIKTKKNLGVALSEQFGLPLIDPSAIDPVHMPIHLVEPSLIEKHHALPIYLHDTKLYVAVADPMNATALNEIKFNTGLGVVPVQANPEILLATIALATAAPAPAHPAHHPPRPESNRGGKPGTGRKYRRCDRPTGSVAIAAAGVLPGSLAAV